MLIQSYPFVEFGDLNYCFDYGIMYQRDRSKSIKYDKEYYNNYVNLESSNISDKLTKIRVDLVEKYCQKSVLDIGIGSGKFIKTTKIQSFGYDINPIAIEWLKKNNKFFDPYKDSPSMECFTFWDTLEHIPDPSRILSRFSIDQYVFLSLPIFDNLTKIRESKHYKPNEHYYYFTSNGLIKFMKDSGFQIIELSDLETRTGRENILTFVFKKIANYC